ncbi:hypothetical protein HY029_00675 [Candidatus Gottesmanbacteria bacterium]|nr:hypothetical protein [Candidatus Gottesmanbacteria bacterium]
MKKDIAVAIFVGFIIGIVVALTAVNLPVILKEGIKISKGLPAPTVTPIPVNATTQNLDFTLDSPKDESIAESKTVEFSGHAKAGQSVFIESFYDHNATIVHDSGQFSTKLNLAEGVNNIFVSIFDDTGNSSSKTINVYFTSEKL